MNYPVFVVVSGLVLLGCPHAPRPAPEPSSAAPTADELFERYIAFSGGRDTITATQNLRMSGAMEMPDMQLSMPMVRWQAAPDRSLTTVSMMGVGEIQEGFDGATAWSVHPVMGPALKEGAELAEERRNSDFFGVLHYADHYPERAVAGQEEYGGEPCWRVEVKTDDQQPRTLYFAADDGMLVGTVASIPSEMGLVPMRSTVTAVRTFGEQVMASETLIEVGAMRMKLVIDSVEVNLPDDTLPSFAPPPAVQALKDELDNLPE